MALPTNTDVTTLDYKWRGTPFCSTSGSTSVDMNTMDYKWRGTPFVGNPYPAATPPATGTSAVIPTLLFMGIG